MFNPSSDPPAAPSGGFALIALRFTASCARSVRWTLARPGHKDGGSVRPRFSAPALRTLGAGAGFAQATGGAKTGRWRTDSATVLPPLPTPRPFALRLHAYARPPHPLDRWIPPQKQRVSTSLAFAGLQRSALGRGAQTAKTADRALKPSSCRGFAAVSLRASGGRAWTLPQGQRNRPVKTAHLSRTPTRAGKSVTAPLRSAVTARHYHQRYCPVLFFRFFACSAAVRGDPAFSQSTGGALALG
jgi:hypothetical protein